MNKSVMVKIGILPLAALVLVASFADLASAGRGRTSVGEVLLEGGVAFPYGDLSDDYLTQPLGSGAENGFEVGIRYRHFFNRFWAISPTFHYVEFGDFVGEIPGDGGLIEVSESIIRYGVDVQYFLPPHRSGDLHPFFSAGLGMTRNRHREDLIQEQQFAEEPFNTLTLAVGGGVRAGAFEASLIYNVNRFETARLFEDRFKESYNWDYLVLRIGFAFPTQ